MKCEISPEVYIVFTFYFIIIICYAYKCNDGLLDRSMYVQL
jgi:hypothetical protein